MHTRAAILLVFFISIVLLVIIFSDAYRNYSDSGIASPVTTNTFRNPIQSYSPEPIQAIPQNIALDQDRVSLGEKLFHDPRLSQDNTISCASCHNLNTNGTDNQALSKGINGAPGLANAPTVFNSSYNISQFWDGRAASLEEQIEGPLHNPLEMASNWEQVLRKLTADHEYLRLFNQIYADGITVTNIKNAITVFEQSLITPDSPFDRYLNGDQNSLSANALKGYYLFKNYGCISCHQGMNIGGNMYQKFGIMGDYFAIKKQHGQLQQADYGRYNVTGIEQDKHVFKVPGLRNVALTAPYFHDASAASLEEAIKTMGLYQLGRSLSEEDIQLISAFLHSLTGQWKGKTLQ